MNYNENPIRNTRQTYDKQLERVIVEVQVQFKSEPPAWIPLETLLAITDMESFALID